jgi:hypothetical protein
MNDQDKIEELTAEIARLHWVLTERQAKIGQLMGEAARAGIAGAAVRGVGDAIRAAALEVMEHRIGELPITGYLLDNDASRKALQALADALAAPAAPSEPVGKLTKSEASKILDLALDLEKTGRITSLSEGQEKTDYMMRNRQIQCALTDVLNILTVPEPNLKNGFLYQEGLDIKAVLYTDDINDKQVCRDDLWLATTEALNKLAEGPAAPIQAAPLPELTGPSVAHDNQFSNLLLAMNLAARADEIDPNGATAELILEASAALVAHIDSRLADSPSPAPAQSVPAERTCYEDNDGATRCISCHANHDQNQDHGEDCWVDRAEKVSTLAASSPLPKEGGAVYGIIDPDYGRIYTMVRKLAWEEGYAIGLHGSFTRDLDLIAVPWDDGRNCNPEKLVRRILQATGMKEAHGNPGAKPHGRLVWTLLLPEFGDPRFVDLSIMSVETAAPGASIGDDPVVLTDDQIHEIASGAGIYKKTQTGCYFDPCKLVPFARAIESAIKVAPSTDKSAEGK